MEDHQNNVKTEAAIHSILEKRKQAVFNKNADAILEDYATNSVQFGLAAPLKITGKDEAGVLKWLGGYSSPIMLDMQDVVIHASDTIAFCNYLYHIQGTLTNGQQVSMWVRATLGFELRSQQWKIIHDHNSVPFDMETFKALLDIQP